MHPDEYQRIYEAEQSHWWYRGLHTLVLALLRRHLLRDSRPTAGAAPPRILDAGCGTGGLAAAMSEFAAVTALDASCLALGFCRRRGLSRLVAGSVEALPFGDGVFDAVTSLDVLYHAAVTDDEHAMRELGRVLRRDGVLVVNLPAYDWLRGSHDAVIQTARRYTLSRVRSMMEGAALRVVWASHWNALLLPLAVAVRMRHRLGGRRRPDRSDVGPVHPALNRALLAVLGAERRFLHLGGLPIGLSVLAVGRRSPHIDDS
jgi:SAM-dependent methyltransferase